MASQVTFALWSNIPYCLSLFLLPAATIWMSNNENATSLTMLVSIIPKKGKNVLMLSTFHDEDKIDPVKCKQTRSDYLLQHDEGWRRCCRPKKRTRLSNEYQIDGPWPFSVAYSTKKQWLARSYTTWILKRWRNEGYTLHSLQRSLPHLLKRTSTQTFSITLKMSINAIVDQEVSANNQPRGRDQHFFKTNFNYYNFI